VDRIVPGYPRDKAAEYQNDLGYEDVNLVECEQFHLWVIEGPQWIKKEFPADQAGLNVLFTDNQKPYKTRKVRILNGAHTTLTPVAYLYGIDTVRESVEHEVMGKFLKDAIYDEIIPTLELPKAELEQFAKDVLERFSNPYVKHLLMSISLNSMPKYETRVLPSLLTYVKGKNTLPKKLVFGLASMMVFYKGDRNGEKIAVADGADIIELYADAWKVYDGSKDSVADVVKKVLAYESNWKMDLNTVAGLTDLVTEYVYAILTDGIQKAIHVVM
jgi:tagaturonate reductase